MILLLPMIRLNAISFKTEQTLLLSFYLKLLLTSNLLVIPICNPDNCLARACHAIADLVGFVNAMQHTQFGWNSGFSSYNRTNMGLAQTYDSEWLGLL